MAELGNLSHLKLNSNRLRGPIPPELGDLTRLESLGLSVNELSGVIPASLGGLSKLKALTVGRNDLSGSIPAEMWDLETLEVLSVMRNSSLRGPLPPAATRLGALEILWMEETRLCVPPDSVFDAWLAGIKHFSGSRCR